MIVEEKTKSKKIYFEFLRIVCIFFVMFNHTTPTGYLAFINQPNVILYYLFMSLSILCKVAVPIFFMISGALLLPKKESIAVLYKKRIVKITIVLVFISIPYYIWLSKDSPLSLIGFIRTLYCSQATTALWYLYSYLGFLCILPFLRKMAASLSNTDYKYLIILHICLSFILTTIDKIILHNQSHNPAFTLMLVTEANVFYPLIGYYIEHRIEETKFNKRNNILLVIASVISILITCILSQIFYMQVESDLDTSVYESFFNTLICIPSTAFFFIFKSTVHISKERKEYTLISQMGASVFGVYLIEKFCRALTSPIYSILTPYIGTFLSTIFYLIVALFIGLMLVSLVRNLPVIGKYVRMFI